MVVQPKVKGFMCTTAHPEGCKESVRRQIEYVKSQPKAEGPKKVLVLGASMGYGLASRIALTYACGADSIGVIFDKPGKEKRTASAGWYNTAAFEQFAQNDGHYAKSINGDAYSQEIKEETIALIKKDFGQVDMVIYSLAAPRRKAPDGVTYRSVLKTVDKEFTNQSIDLLTNELTTVTIPPATEEEINDTIKVMGGEDWMFGWKHCRKQMCWRMVRRQLHIPTLDRSLRIRSIMMEVLVRQSRICIAQQIKSMNTYREQRHMLQLIRRW